MLASPKATATAWTTRFPTYDHPHTYRIAAWATDLDGQPDTSKAQREGHAWFAELLAG
jgi:hypothetical protein